MNTSNSHQSSRIEVEVEGKPRIVDLEAGRRAFLRSAGLGAATLALLGGVTAMQGEAQAQGGPSDADVLNFALNLEYLEAEFYLIAAFGRRLAFNDTTGTGTRGAVTGGRAVAFATQAVREYAREIALDEEAHVKFLRAGFGAARVARPRIDVGQAFRDAAAAAGLGANFDAYANENNFSLAAFIFEDVGVTAYKGAARLLSNKDFLEAAAGILAVEAYHAANIRTVLFAKGLINEAQRISNLRDAVDGGTDLDQGIRRRGADGLIRANIVPTDANGIAFSRSTGQVLSIVYLGNNAGGGFFPNGLNGDIR
jgi:hypothetical protein